MQDSHKLKGIIQEGGEDDLSFYYSLPNLPFTGWLTYTDADGLLVETDVSGQGWVDRQWGDFSTKSWEWSSFRFADGDRVNLYSFWNGYQVGAYQTKDKKTSYFSNFAVQPTGYTKTKNGVWVAYGWNYKIPVKDSIYRVEPLDPRDTVENQNNTFYEGLGRLVDQHDKQVGWAVNESMDVRAMHNGPYDEHE
jgi:predicted secreted hydrolase